MTGALLALLLSASPCPAPESAAESPDAAVLARCEYERLSPERTGTDPALLQAILDRPGFQDARARSGDGFARLLELLATWLERLVGTDGARSFAEWTRTAVLALAIAILLWGVLRIRGRRRAGRGLRIPEEGPALAGAALEAPVLHLERARRALSVAPREAIREALLALLSGLERAGLARPDRVRTNQELAAELPSRGAGADLVREVRSLLAWYDAAFYSLAEVDHPGAAGFVGGVQVLVDRLDGERA